jgi:hypothetical protein
MRLDHTFNWCGDEPLYIRKFLGYTKSYTCASAVVAKYQKRISSPLLDRIDIHTEVPRVDYEKLSEDRLGESSEVVRVSRLHETPSERDSRNWIPNIRSFVMLICASG